MDVAWKLAPVADFQLSRMIDVVGMDKNSCHADIGRDFEIVRHVFEHGRLCGSYAVKFQKLIEGRALAEFRSILEVSIPRAASAADPMQLGWVDKKKMMHTIELVRESYGLKETIDPEAIYTNTYVAEP